MNRILQGDVLEQLKTLSDESIDCVITSPPYWGLRDYGMDDQIGQEKSPEEYTARMVDIFHEARRVLKDCGTLWLNLGDSYAGSGKGNNPKGKQGTSKGTLFDSSTSGLIPKGLKTKDLVGIPWRVAFALQADGWYLRQDIIWAKPNPMPESVTDRCTKSHEYIFLLAKSNKYYFDNEAIKYDCTNTAHSGKTDGGVGRMYVALDKRFNNRKGTWKNTYVAKKANKRSVWTVSTKPFKEAHFATFPQDLIVPMIKAGCPIGGTVLDPFFGSGTTGVVVRYLLRNYIGIELNPEYIKIANGRLRKETCKEGLSGIPKAPTISRS